MKFTKNTIPHVEITERPIEEAWLKRRNFLYEAIFKMFWGEEDFAQEFFKLMIEAEDEYVEYFKFEATEGSKERAVVELKQAKGKEIDKEHKQIIGIELMEKVCLYLYQKDDEFLWIGTAGDKEYNIMDPACGGFSDDVPKYSIQVLESSIEFIILVANEASTDIGVIGFTKQDQSWKSWTLNEGAGIALPIINSQDTFPKQIWLSFDSKVSIAGVTLDSPKIPPSPIFNIELDNGEVLGYYCIRTGLDDNDLYFSKMISNSEKFESAEKEEVRVDKPESVTAAAAIKIEENITQKQVDPSFGIASKKAERESTSDKPSISKPATGFSFGAFAKKNSEEHTPETLKSAAGFSFAAAASKSTSFGFGSNQSSPFGKSVTVDLNNPFAVSGLSKNGFGLPSSSETNNPFAVRSVPKDKKAEKLESAFPPSVHSSIPQDDSDSECETDSQKSENSHTTPSIPFGSTSQQTSQLNPADTAISSASGFSFGKPAATHLKLEEPKSVSSSSAFSFKKPFSTSENPEELKLDTKSAFLFAPAELKVQDVTAKVESAFTKSALVMEAADLKSLAGKTPPNLTKVESLATKSSFDRGTQNSGKDLSSGFKSPFGFAPPSSTKAESPVIKSVFTLGASSSTTSVPEAVIGKTKPTFSLSPPNHQKPAVNTTPKIASKSLSNVKSIEEKNQILVDKFDIFYQDLEDDMTILSDVFKTIKGEITDAGTPRTLNSPTLGDLAKVQVQITKIAESHTEENKAREKLYESAMKLKHAGALLTAKQEEIESRIAALKKGKDSTAQLQSQFGRKLSPEAEMLQEQLAFKQNLIENDLELALKIADDLKSNKTRSNNFTLLKIANTTSQIRRSIAAINRDLDMTEARLDILSLDLSGESPKKLPEKVSVTPKKSFSFGLQDDDLIADDVVQDPEVLALETARKEFFEKLANRPVVVQIIKSSQPAHRPIPLKEWSTNRKAKNAKAEVQKSEEPASDDDFVKVEGDASLNEDLESESFLPKNEQDQVEEEFEEFLSQGSASPEKANCTITPPSFAESKISTIPGKKSNFSFASSAGEVKPSFTASPSQSFFTQATKPLESASTFSLTTAKPAIPISKASTLFTTPAASPAVTADSKPFSFTTLTAEKKDIPSFSFTPEKKSDKATFSFAPSKLAAEGDKLPKLSDAKPFFTPLVTDVSKAQSKTPLFGIGSPLKKPEITIELKDGENGEALADTEALADPLANTKSVENLGIIPEETQPVVVAKDSTPDSHVEKEIPTSPKKTTSSSPLSRPVVEKGTNNLQSPKNSHEPAPSSPVKFPIEGEVHINDEAPSFAEDPTFSVGELGGVSAIEKSEIVITPLSKSPVKFSSVPRENLPLENEVMSGDDNIIENYNEEMEEEKPEEPVPSFAGFGGFQSTPTKTINPMFGVPASSDKPVGSFGSGAAFGKSAGAFGQPSQGSSFGQPQNASPFGAPKTSAFGQQSSATSTAFGQSQSSPSNFGSNATPTKPTAFGATSNTTSAFGQSFGSQQSPAFGQSAFGSSAVNNQPSFGQSGFGAPPSSQFTFGQSAFSAASSNQPAFGKSGFGSAASAQPAFGQSGFGQAPATPFSAVPTSSSGFAGFASQTNQPTSFAAVAQNSGGTPAYASAQPSAFGSSQSTFRQQSAFGSGFGQSTGQSSAFVQPSVFGQSTFGQGQTQSAFGQQNTSSAVGSGSAFGNSGGNSTFGAPNTNSNK